MPKVLTLDDILAANDMVTEDVEVPEWGGTVRVRSLDAVELDAIGEKLAKTNDMAKFNRMLVMASMIGEDGKPIGDLAKLDELGAKSGKAVRRVTEVALKLNGMVSEDVEGNSASAPTG